MSLLPLLGPRPLRRSAAVTRARSGLLTPGAADAVGRRGGWKKRALPGLREAHGSGRDAGEAALGDRAGPNCARSHPCIVCSKRG
jgi:hypothetical protein